MSRKAKGPGLLHGGTGLRKGQPHVSTAGTQFLPGGCLQTQHPAFSDGLCLMEGVETAKTDDWETLSSGQTSKPGTHCREWRKDYTERAKEYDFFFFKWALGPKILLSMVSLLCFLCDGPLVLPWAWCFYSGFYRPDVWVPPLKFWCGRAFP